MARDADWRGEALRAGAVGLGYGALAFLLLGATRSDALVEAIWFCNALLAWALLSARYQAWPLYIAAAAAGHVSAHVVAGDPLDMTLAFLVADMFESAFVAMLLRMKPGALAFQNRAGVVHFLICCLIAPLASACVAWAGYSAFVGSGFTAREFLVWSAVDALGLIVFLPLMLMVSLGRLRDLRGKEGRLAVAVTTLIAIVVVSVALEVSLLRLLALPALMLIAFELGVAGLQVCLGVQMFAWLGLVFTGNSIPLFGVVDLRDNLLLVQMLAIVFAITLMPLGVVVEQRQRLTKDLQDTLDETREAWGAIIAGEARYQLVVSNVSETVMRVAIGGGVLFASSACNELFAAKTPIEGRNIMEMLHPEDRDLVRERVNQAVDKGLFNLAHRWRLRIQGDDGAWHVIDARVTPVSLGKPGQHEFIVVLRAERDDEIEMPVSERQLRA